MNRVFIRILTLLLCAAPLLSRAHIGSPNVFYTGPAGAYPVHVVIRPPAVIPGLAEISVRVSTNGSHRVQVLPLHWKTGRNGAPTPDDAFPVSGEPNLFAAQLWFMVGGAQSVEVHVEGQSGKGTVVIPVNAVATAVLPMPRGLGVTLAVLGGTLILLAAGIVGAAVRESVLPPGATPGKRRRLAAGAMTVASLFLIAGLLWGGKQWWDKEAGDYRNNRLFRPVQTMAKVEVTEAGANLRLQYALDLMRRNGPLVPDHGKLMHLFLVREPGLDVFAHLHPRKLDWQRFEAPLPDLPPGDYRLYADITYETGFSDTLTTRLSIPTGKTNHMPGKRLDADDGWRVSEQLGASTAATFPINEDLSMALHRPDALMPDREVRLKFSLVDRAGNPVPLESYMGMRGHLILRRDDGSVFTHLHPSGSFSMAAQQLFEMRLEGKAPLKVASYTNDPLCQLPSVYTQTRDPQRWADNEVTFPYSFPKPGNYRLWLQTRVRGEIITAVFDVTVQGTQLARQ